VQQAKLVTSQINTGPDGHNDTRRTIAIIQTSTEDSDTDALVPVFSGPHWPQRFAGLAQARSAASHVIYFSENNPDSEFYITVDNQTPVLFSPNNPPALIAHQGTVEEWTIENRTLENHEFHLHQVHFMIQSQNNFELNGNQPAPGIVGQVADTVEDPYWDGNPNHPYPNVKVRWIFVARMSGTSCSTVISWSMKTGA
jgi:FtsP/CotA-like multicopper oxidase with cupredoxin domain